MTARLAMLTALAVLVAPRAPRAPRLAAQAPARSPAATEIDQVRRGYIEAYNRKDPAAVAAFYADDAMLVGANGSVLQGRPAIEGLLKLVAPTWVQLTATPIRLIEQGGALAWEVGSSTAQTNVRGRPVTTVTRYLVLLSKETGSWKIKALMSVVDSAAVGRRR